MQDLSESIDAISARQTHILLGCFFLVTYSEGESFSTSGGAVVELRAASVKSPQATNIQGRGVHSTVNPGPSNSQKGVRSQQSTQGETSGFIDDFQATCC